MSNDQKALARQQDMSKHDIFQPFDLDVKGQRRIWIMVLHDTSSYGDSPICQIWYTNMKSNKNYGSNKKTCQKPYKFEFEYRSMLYQCCIRIINVRSHCLMVIHPCAKYGTPMSKQKKLRIRHEDSSKTLLI